MKENILAGFKVAEIIPLNPSAVLDRIPDPEDVIEFGKRYLVPVVNLLHTARFTISIYY